MQQLEDRFGRRFHYLRLSITDACNFKCEYCLPDGYKPEGKPRHLQLDELRRVMTAFAHCGTRKIRITGGEPSLRKDFEQVIEAAANTPLIETVATTTNGYRLAEHAAEWQRRGLQQINVSADSLDGRDFERITGDSRFDLVMRGIDRALELDYRRVKINAVLLKGHNADQLPLFLNYIRDRKVDIRFIELMETGLHHDYFKQHHLAGAVIQQQLLQQGWQLDPADKDAGPALNYSHPDYAGRIGLIMPYAKDFCASCNRLRVSSTGKLHLCLFGEAGIELRDLLGSDNHIPELQQRLHRALISKHETHHLHDGDAGATPHLASIGG
ncbi:GTP 3',8-cyclase MoaA [Ferrimonas lipolytica]|uniref:GTP 3',8-cyclase n=1 Tax=Ferrimonas lipolytica TaxID=2724191 RepID=A0A6H1UGQ9_9GAMM|nr:GTP 3',8-cyclase MoaA [Ferrimonas lipolytica]QIZ78295.1 GTP 3',8-cyclase MoaA [Ferrimonas lipolytica]